MEKYSIVSVELYALCAVDFLHLNGYSIQEYPAIWEDDPDSTLQGVVSSSKRFYKDLRAIKKNKKHYLEKEGEHVD